MNGQSLARALSLELAIAPPARLASLFDVHHERLYRLARRLAPSKDDALDLVQETFLKAARSPNSGPLPCRTHSYGLDFGYEYAVLGIFRHGDCFPTFLSDPGLIAYWNLPIERHRRSLFGDSDDGTHPDTRRRHSYHTVWPEDGNVPGFGWPHANRVNSSGRWPIPARSNNHCRPSCGLSI